MKPPKEIELYHDAWERFERGVTAIAKAKPMHRPGKAKKAAKAPRHLAKS